VFSISRNDARNTQLPSAIHSSSRRTVLCSYMICCPVLPLLDC
jgi:hypothetical protein